MNVISFGASITQGYWGIEHGWVDRVRRHLNKQQFAADKYHGVYNLGVDGDKTADISKRIKSELQARIKSHHTVMPIVVIQAGINDNLDETIDLVETKAAYKDMLHNIINEIEDLYTEIVLVGYPSCDEEKTTPVSWGAFYYTNERLKACEVVMAEVARGLGVKHIPVLDEFKKHVDAGEDLLADGLHPNDAGHELIYQIVMPKLQELLK